MPDVYEDDSELKREQKYWADYYFSERAQEVLAKQLKNQLPLYFQREFERAERIFRCDFHRPARALILGAGMGTVSVWCANHYPQWEIFSLDLALEGLISHISVAQTMKLTWSGHCVVADWDHLPFEDNLFDFCVVDRALHHMQNPARSLRSVAHMMKSGAILIGLREPFLAVSRPEMREAFAANEKEAGAHDQVWYPGEWKRFFRAAEFDLKIRVHLEDCYRFYAGWGPHLPGIRSILKRLPVDFTARLLFPYVWYHGSTKIAKYTLYARKKGTRNE